MTALARQRIGVMGERGKIRMQEQESKTGRQKITNGGKETRTAG
jgi:hypothetical protein